MLLFLGPYALHIYLYSSIAIRRPDEEHLCLYLDNFFLPGTKKTVIVLLLRSSEKKYYLYSSILVLWTRLWTFMFAQQYCCSLELSRNVSICTVILLFLRPKGNVYICTVLLLFLWPTVQHLYLYSIIAILGTKIATLLCVQ